MEFIWKCNLCDNQMRDKECKLGEEKAALCMKCGWMFFEKVGE